MLHKRTSPEFQAQKLGSGRIFPSVGVALAQSPTDNAIGQAFGCLAGPFAKRGVHDTGGGQ